MGLTQFLGQHSWILIALALVLGITVPTVLLKPYLIYLLMVIMFFSCLNVHFTDMFGKKVNISKKTLVLIIIHLFSPLILLALKDFFSPNIFLGLMIAASVPCGMSIVFLAKLYGADPSRALVITTISNLLSPGIVPLVLFLLADVDVHVNFWSIIQTLVFLVLIPFLAAAIVRRSKKQHFFNKIGHPISIIFLFLIIWTAISSEHRILVEQPQQTLNLLGIVIILVMLNFVLGYHVGRSKREKLTYGIAASYKNYTMAIVIAVSLFNPLVALPAVIYTIVNNFLLLPLEFLRIRQKRH